MSIFTDFATLYFGFTTFLFKTFSYMVAPILYHTSVDGYAATFIFNILELTDTFALYRIFMAFVAAYLLYRNYLYSVNKENNVTNAAHSGFVRNDLKLLNNSIVTTSRRFSQVTKVFITLFTTKK